MDQQQSTPPEYPEFDTLDASGQDAAAQSRPASQTPEQEAMAQTWLSQSMFDCYND